MLTHSAPYETDYDSLITNEFQKNEMLRRTLHPPEVYKSCSMSLVEVVDNFAFILRDELFPSDCGTST